MARETATQRKTRIGILLAAYDADRRQLAKLAKDVEAMKEEIRQIDPGTYGEWQLSTGSPREILDQAAIKRAYTERGWPLPTKLTEAPINVTPVAGKK